MAHFGLSVLLPALCIASGAQAAPGTPAGHSATLESPVSADNLTAHGLLWRCAGAQCVATASNSRPVVVCQALAREAGPMIAFSAGGELLSAEQMARCNSASDREHRTAQR